MAPPRGERLFTSSTRARARRSSSHVLGLPTVRAEQLVFARGDLARAEALGIADRSAMVPTAHQGYVATPDDEALTTDVRGRGAGEEYHQLRRPGRIEGIETLVGGGEH